MSDEQAMQEAIALAHAAAEAGETPIGCVVLGGDGVVIGRGLERKGKKEGKGGVSE